MILNESAVNEVSFFMSNWKFFATAFTALVTAIVSHKFTKYKMSLDIKNLGEQNDALAADLKDLKKEFSDYKTTSDNKYTESEKRQAAVLRDIDHRVVDVQKDLEHGKVYTTRTLDEIRSTMSDINTMIASLK